MPFAGLPVLHLPSRACYAPLAWQPRAHEAPRPRHRPQLALATCDVLMMLDCGAAPRFPHLMCAVHRIAYCAGSSHIVPCAPLALIVGLLPEKTPGLDVMTTAFLGAFAVAKGIRSKLCNAKNS